MTRYFVIIPMMLAALSLCAAEISPTEILKAVDRNIVTNTFKATSRMTVSTRRATRTITAISYGAGNDKAFTEYLSPPREKGTKMLKLEDDLWIYDPSTDRIIQISGNMLKQSVMGSDLSYEDMMEDISLVEDYSAEISSEIEYESRPCWVLDLTAVSDDVSYHRQKVYVDKERFVPLYQELYAKSGKLLKTIKASEVKRISGRWYPTRYLFKDELKQGNGTEYVFESIELDIQIEPHIFSKASLRK
jgi:outer membrane lipoprotein-sorting protein